MKKLTMSVIALTVFSSSIVFADDQSSPACVAIAKACKSAGFERMSEDKKFWKNCMEPLLLGQQVKDVTVKPEDVKACREKKVEVLQTELKKLQEVK